MDAVDVASEADESQPQPSDADGGNGKEDPNRKKSNVRKRTKTGCLTCRKRRIKCDETRPTCNNCVKSKRICEGYNQRVIFKDPMGAFQGGSFGPLVYHPESSQTSFHNLATPQSKSSSQAPQLATIAPKPPSLDFHGQSPIQYGQPFQGQASTSTSSNFNFNQLPYSQPALPTPSLISPVSPLQPKVEDDPLQNYLPTPLPDEGFGKDADFLRQRQVPYPKVEVSSVSPDFEQPPQPNLVSPDADFEYAFSDDDASMADSDDEFNEANEEGYYGTLVTSHMDGPLEGVGTRMRSFSAFAEATILTSYIPSPHNSPLNDNRTAAIFWHFVNVTGPSMSLYERHPFDYSKLAHNLPIPKAGHNIWTYTFPIIAFNHPALLQAMLALGALQIARLQMVPPTAAMKHYHLAIRRVAKNVRSQIRRTQPATLAATLLLAYFEVWNSDHNKWCNHLFGARLVFKEIEFREMTKNIIPLKRARRAMLEQERNNPSDPFFMGFDSQNMVNDDLDDINFKLVHQLTNQVVDYGDGGSNGFGQYYTDRDIEHYEHLRDLFWWYAKMDVYQSVLGGTKLFMEYEHWTQAPPRSPMGRLEAIYGTYDHLMLLLGRVCSFAAKDMPRKKKVWKNRGPPGGSPPMFAGMLPTQGTVSLPRGFSPPRDTPPQNDNPEDIDLELATAEAQSEWDSIRQAFEIIKAHFGPAFQPLGPEYADRRDSPFGPTIQYRTFSVAGIWMNLYMGLIVLYRAHPQMPPVAMMAAGMQAQHTAHYAQEIGRISAGLSDDCANLSEISTLVGAAFIESSFCLFVAAIQYQDAAQRHWMVRRMHDISRLTGWQSARNIADGCESAWTKAAALGRGPPYVRNPELKKTIPASVWDSPRQIKVRIEELDNQGVEGRLVLAKSEQAHYALGLIGVETELQRLDLREEL